MKVYLAGFDVFKANNHEIYRNMVDACVNHGIEALIPLDNELTNPEDIFANNIDHLNTCDVVIANLNPFRGKELDSGTVFEIGYAYAIGKVVVGYTQIENWANHIGIATISGGIPYCQDGYIVENFGRKLNLMLSESSVILNGDFNNALDYVTTIEID